MKKIYFITASVVTLFLTGCSFQLENTSNLKEFDTFPKTDSQISTTSQQSSRLIDKYVTIGDVNFYYSTDWEINLDETVKFNVPEQNVSIHISKVETSEYDDKSLDYYLDDDDTLIEKKNVLFDNETGLLATMEARHSDLEKFDLTLPPTYYCKGLFKHENILYSITFYLHDYKGENTNTFVDNYISNYIDII